MWIRIGNSWIFSCRPASRAWANWILSSHGPREEGNGRGMLPVHVCVFWVDPPKMARNKNAGSFFPFRPYPAIVCFYWVFPSGRSWGPTFRWLSHLSLKADTAIWCQGESHMNMAFTTPETNLPKIPKDDLRNHLENLASEAVLPGLGPDKAARGV